jgi:hypothetical protein
VSLRSVSGLRPEAGVSFVARSNSAISVRIARVWTREAGSLSPCSGRLAAAPRFVWYDFCDSRRVPLRSSVPATNWGYLCPGPCRIRSLLALPTSLWEPPRRGGLLAAFLIYSIQDHEGCVFYCSIHPPCFVLERMELQSSDLRKSADIGRAAVCGQFLSCWF